MVTTRSRGFTLTELMVTLAVAAVLIAIAAPSYRDFILDTGMSAEANEFLTTVNFARSEAVKRNVRVTMCRSSDGAGCANAGNWAQGWIVFTDLDGAALGTYNAGTDEILRVHAALTTQSTLTGTTNVATYISFIPDGRSQLADNATAQTGDIDLCNSGSSVKDRRLHLQLGRAQVTQIDC